MGNFFDYENGIMSKIARLADTVTLGVLWMICSVPIFTVGASSAAFYYAYNRCIRQKMGYAWRTFFESFKSNFKQATKIWLLVLGIFLIAAVDSYILWQMEQMVLIDLLRAVIIVLTLSSILWGLYLFPYLSRFDVPSKAAMKNCALMVLANLPQSLLLLLLFAVCAVGFVYLPLLSLFIPSLYMFLANRILEKVFRKYMRPEDLNAQIMAEQETSTF